MGKICAYCWASGLIEFGSRCPKGALPLIRGPEEAVKDAVGVLAVHAYDGENYLVPKGLGWLNGDMDSALGDVRRFADGLEARVAKRNK